MVVWKLHVFVTELNKPVLTFPELVSLGIDMHLFWTQAIFELIELIVKLTEIALYKTFNF